MDDKVIASCKQNDSKSWEKLYDEGFRLAKWVAMKKLFNCGESVCKDIAQETMIALCRKISLIKDGCHCERLIRSIARNKTVDYIRRHSVQVEEYFEDRGYSEEDAFDGESSAPRDPNPVDAPSLTPRDAELEESVILALRRSLAKLGYPCKPILRRFYLDHAKHREIAEEMGVQVNQMGMRISRCLKNLRTIFSEENIRAEDVL